MVREIPLTKGQVALVDDDDYEWLSSFKWHAVKSRRKYGPQGYYAARTTTKTERLVRQVQHIWMHKEILGLPEALTGDHIDGNGLNNQRLNLRSCTGESENQANRTQLRPNTSSIYRGVTWHAQGARWQASIKKMGASLYLGLFDTQAEAAAAYDVAAIREFGEFARPNFERKAA